MLKLKYLFENYDLARKCLAFYEYDEESLEEMLSYFRISSNAIYPFRSNNEVCFLRLSPTEEKTLSSVLSEIHLIQWLRENGFPAMKPVAMKTGEFAKELCTEYGTYNVSCFEKVPGNSVEDTPNTPAIIKGYGEILGRLHEMLKNYPDSHKHRNHKDLLKEIGERIENYNAPESIKTEYLTICNELEQLAISSDSYGVIHYDFEPDNVFYDETANAFSVIDFDDAICCWYALDIVRALDSLDEIPDAERHFLEGYEGATDLTYEQRQSFYLMRRLVHLQEYATILHVLSEPITEMPDWMNGLMEKLNYKLQYLEGTITTYLSE